MERDNRLKEQLLVLEEKLLKPEIRASKNELKKLLSENFFEFGSSGRVLYKNEDISDDGIGAVKMTLSDFDIHPLSQDVVLTTYRIYNEESKQHTLRSSIWKYSNGSWQMFFHQGTKTN
ncbi:MULTISPECIES: DUF4440 domain-containing protein [Bacillaceae]|uniref:nuclear transport factor 2 family protein n=1 Tax=Bacillaceae TaxID=186817 RepID=UPI001BDF634F|nr:MULTISPECIES: DUF4440 domain-containing protein [Bacillaceae]MDX8361530.1 DUF4440 domain-containing protein [Cytobacillus sp. IB215316]